MNRLTDGELSRLEREVIDKTQAARLLGGDTSALQMMQRAIAELKCTRFGGGASGERSHRDRHAVEET